MVDELPGETKGAGDVVVHWDCDGMRHVDADEIEVFALIKNGSIHRSTRRGGNFCLSRRHVVIASRNLDG